MIEHAHQRVFEGPEQILRCGSLMAVAIELGYAVDLFRNPPVPLQQMPLCER